MCKHSRQRHLVTSSIGTIYRLCEICRIVIQTPKLGGSFTVTDNQIKVFTESNGFVVIDQSELQHGDFKPFAESRIVAVKDKGDAYTS